MTSTPTRGRPRNVESGKAIVRETLRLLIEQGYDAMSVDAVAAAAGVSKPTIYRRYPAKRDLVIAAVSSLAATLPPPPDTGSVHADLLAFMVQSFTVFQRGIGFPMLGALLVKERDDPALLDLFRSHVVRPRMIVVASLLQRGIATGELRPDIQIDVVTQMVMGSIFARHIAGQPEDPSWLQSIVETIWAGIARPSAGDSHGAYPVNST